MTGPEFLHLSGNDEPRWFCVETPNGWVGRWTLDSPYRDDMPSTFAATFLTEHDARMIAAEMGGWVCNDMQHRHEPADPEGES